MLSSDELRESVETAAQCLQPPTPPTTLPPRAVGWDRRDILDSANLHSCTGQSSECSLTSWSGLFGTGSTGRSELDVESGDADFFALDSDVLSGQHGGVGLSETSAATPQIAPRQWEKEEMQAAHQSFSLADSLEGMRDSRQTRLGQP